MLFATRTFDALTRMCRVRRLEKLATAFITAVVHCSHPRLIVFLLRKSLQQELLWTSKLSANELSAKLSS